MAKPTCRSRARCFIKVFFRDLQPTSGWLLSHHKFNCQRTSKSLNHSPTNNFSRKITLYMSVSVPFSLIKIGIPQRHENIVPFKADKVPELEATITYPFVYTSKTLFFIKQSNQLETLAITNTAFRMGAVKTDTRIKATPLMCVWVVNGTQGLTYLKE